MLSVHGSANGTSKNASQVHVTPRGSRASGMADGALSLSLDEPWIPASWDCEEPTRTTASRHGGCHGKKKSLM